MRLGWAWDRGCNVLHVVCVRITAREHRLGAIELMAGCRADSGSGVACSLQLTQPLVALVYPPGDEPMLPLRTQALESGLELKGQMVKTQMPVRRQQGRRDCRQFGFDTRPTDGPALFRPLLHANRTVYPPDPPRPPPPRPFKDGTPALLFLGSPRLANLEEMNGHGLYLSDIPLHDMSRDFVLLAEQRQVRAERAGVCQGGCVSPGSVERQARGASPWMSGEAMARGQQLQGASPGKGRRCTCSLAGKPGCRLDRLHFPKHT